MTTLTSPEAATAAPASGPLERLLGRPRSRWTADGLAALLEERDIRLLSLMHVGGDGTIKTLDFAPSGPAHARDILAGGERADGSSLFPGLGIRPDASDVVLVPRLETAFLDPFSPHPTLAVLCGHEGRDRRPLPQSPDTIVRAAADRLAAVTGAELWAHGEVEYFLGRTSTSGDPDGPADRGYHATSPFVLGESLRRRALVLLASIGVPVKYAHSEVGHIAAPEGDGLVWEQHEIELALAPLPRAADAVVLTQWVLRNLAQREGARVSFDPIVRRGHAGTGLHFHLAPAVQGELRDVRRPDGSLTEPAQWILAGLVQLGGALMAFGNRHEYSFVRLSQAKEAPSTIYWGDADRTALLRLPIAATTRDGRKVSPATVEFRLPDGSAHPHLLLAGIAQAMRLGHATPDAAALIERTSAAAVAARSGATTNVPRSFEDVADALAHHAAVLEEDGVFPAALLQQMVVRLRG